MDKKEGETIEDKAEVDKIINEKIRGKKLIFTKYYFYGIDLKGITHEFVQEVFPQFDKVFAIETEKLKQGDMGYELFYRLSNNTSFSIATCPKDKEILIIHAVEYKRSLEKRFKSFNVRR